MQFLIYLSDYMMPLVIFGIVGYGLLCKTDVFDAFVDGAKDGMKVVVGILPTLIGLMIGVGVLRASGAFEAISAVMGPIMTLFHFPAALVPLVIVKMFSSSASTGLLLDIYKSYGTDSQIGFLASLLMCCSETIFYTMSVYFMAAGVKKTRWTLSGALIATMAGIVASVILVNVA